MAGVEVAQVRLAAHMRDKGLKHTRQREQILEVFFEVGGHASIDEVLARVQERMPGIGYATVYRSMKLFVEAGVAQERHFQEAQTRYEPVQSDEHHDHLICTVCRTIFEFEDPVIEDRQATVAKTHGLHLTTHRHEIYGTCMKPDTCEHRKAMAAQHANGAH
jgi:Fur family transcriptional regulator, ferric uptake regulator